MRHTQQWREKVVRQTTVTQAARTRCKNALFDTIEEERRSRDLNIAELVDVSKWPQVLDCKPSFYLALLLIRVLNALHRIWSRSTVHDRRERMMRILSHKRRGLTVVSGLWLIALTLVLLTLKFLMHSTELVAQIVLLFVDHTKFITQLLVFVSAGA